MGCQGGDWADQRAVSPWQEDQQLALPDLVGLCSAHCQSEATVAGGQRGQTWRVGRGRREQLAQPHDAPPGNQQRRLEGRQESRRQRAAQGGAAAEQAEMAGLQRSCSAGRPGQEATGPSAGEGQTGGILGRVRRPRRLVEERHCAETGLNAGERGRAALEEERDKLADIGLGCRVSCDSMSLAELATGTQVAGVRPLSAGRQ